MDCKQHLRQSRLNLDHDLSNALNLIFQATLKGDQEGFANILQKYPSILEDSAMVAMDTPLHIAARLGNTRIVKEILSRKPEYARNLNQDGYTPLHLASLLGHLEVVKELIHGVMDVCVLKDKYGRTPLYYATMMGRLEVMEELLDGYPEYIMEMNAARETSLNIAVLCNQYEAYKLLLERFLQENKVEFIDYEGSEGNTVLHLHLPTSRKQFQSLKTLLASNPSIRPAVQVNSTNAAALSALNVLLPDEEMGNKIDKIPQRANALKCGAITTQDYVYEGNMTFADTSNSGNQSFPCIYNPSKNSIVVLLISAVTAMTTFYAALHPPRSILKDAYSYELNQSGIIQFQSQNSILTASFIFLNSIVFFSSIAMIMYLTNEFPMRNWLMISICSLLGSYTCSIMALSTNKHVN